MQKSFKMEVPDLISATVWELARKAFANHEHYVAYNNTLLFVHESDIAFFTNIEDAADFAFNNSSDYDDWGVLRFSSIDEFKAKIESIVPGLEFTPPTEIAAVFNEPQQSFFPKRELQNKTTIIMELEKTLDQLKNKLLFLGFGEGLNAELERQLKEGKPEFSLKASTEFGVDKMEAVLNFRYAEKDGKENYFLNNYVATLVSAENTPSQFFYINNQGQSVTFKEACNLLNGRSVQKELVGKDSQTYRPWLKIDHESMDQKTGYPKLKQFGENYGYDLKEAIGRLPFKFLKYGDQLKTIMKSLEKGNRPEVVLLKDNAELKVFIEANPQFKSLNMYDKDGNKMFYPAQKVAQQYGQAPGDLKTENKQNGKQVGAAAQTANTVSEGQAGYNKKDLLGKNKASNGLIPKTKKSKSNSKSNRLQ
jgi:hypothetical protein